MFEFITNKKDQIDNAVFEKLRDIIYYMAGNEYILEDINRKKELEREYKHFIEMLKLVVYGKTRDNRPRHY